LHAFPHIYDLLERKICAGAFGPSGYRRPLARTNAAGSRRGRSVATVPMSGQAASGSRAQRQPATARRSTLSTRLLLPGLFKWAEDRGRPCLHDPASADPKPAWEPGADAAACRLVVREVVSTLTWSFCIALGTVLVDDL